MNRYPPIMMFAVTVQQKSSAAKPLGNNVSVVIAFQPNLSATFKMKQNLMMTQRMKWYALLVLLPLVAACSSPEQTANPMPAIPDGPDQVEIQPNPDRPDNIVLTDPTTFVRGFCEPTIIDTRLFETQIADREHYIGELKTSSDLRPAKIGAPVTEVGPANDLVAGGMLEKPIVAPDTSFDGISLTGWNPPDPSLAVGPNHIVETVNQSIAFFTKDGEMQFQQRLNDTDQPSFFDDVGVGSFAFDPKCFYDQYSERFFVLALEVYQDINEAYITFAVSDDHDPNGIWHRYRTFAVTQVDIASYWVDYPGLGFDQNGFYVTGNLFLLEGSGAGFAGVLMRSFDKTPLLNGQTATFTDIRDPNTASVQAAQHFGGDNIAPYFVSRRNSTELRVTAINNPLTNPTLSATIVPIPDAASPPAIPNSGGSLSALDGRLINVHWRNGSLWTCHGIRGTDGVDMVSVARWYEISTGDWPTGPNPTLAQVGEVNGPLGVSNFFPAIYTDNSNNTAMVVAYSNESEFASIRATGRLSTDPPNTMGNVELLRAGEAPASGRWGDYFDIALDPNDGSTFWMVGEYQSDQGWQTSINSFSLVVLGDLDGNGVVNLLDVGPFVDLISSGGFDPAGDINGDGVVDLLDVGGFIDLLSN